MHGTNGFLQIHRSTSGFRRNFRRKILEKALESLFLPMIRCPAVDPDEFAILAMLCLSFFGELNLRVGG